jgi:hypothetical protein
MIQILEALTVNSLDRTFVKHDRFNRAVLVQDIQDLIMLFGLLFVDNTNKAVLLHAGNMSLVSHHGGMMQLEEFRNWLDKNDIRSRELRYCGYKGYESICEAAFIPDGFFVDATIPQIQSRFLAWAAGTAEW